MKLYFLGIADNRFALSKLSLMGVGLFPYHPVDVVIDAQGWIYVSLQEGRIFRFRPRPKS